jgi:hypothetical protein
MNKIFFNLIMPLRSYILKPERCLDLSIIIVLFFPDSIFSQIGQEALFHFKTDSSIARFVMAVLTSPQFDIYVRWEYFHTTHSQLICGRFS